MRGPPGGEIMKSRVQPGESAGWGSGTPVIALPPERSAAASNDRTG